MPEQFKYKDLITESDWELLMTIFTNFIGASYLEGKSGFVLDKSNEFVEDLTKNITELAERLKVNLPEGQNVPLDAFPIDGGLSVALDERVLTECAQYFCILNGIDGKQAVNYHKKARSEEQARVYSLFKDALLKDRLACSRMMLALGRTGKTETSFISKNAEGNCERLMYDSTFLDYWSLSMVIEKLDSKVTRKVVGQNQFVFDILGIMPQGNGVMLNFYVA
jgi:hypothetical protein